MEKLFNGLLDISRLEAGVVRSQSEPVCLQDLFDRLASYFDPAAEKDGVELRFRETRLWARADPTLIEQICVNLLTNAIRHAPGGAVLMAARARGREVVIEVIDNGVGIAARDQARIFDEFVQLGNPERDRSKGLGLGLAIAQRLAALLDTRITLKSVEGRGSRFSIRLPRAAEAARPRRAAGSADLIAGLRLLVIDDDPEVRASTRLLLGQWGARVEVAPDLDTAEALIAAGAAFDICLSDYRLPGPVDGLGLIERLSRAPAAPGAFCLLTGDMSPDLLARADAAKVAIIHKPLHPARLRALLNHLAGARPSDASPK
jgi:CheY-like chemotaxis protein